MPAGKVGPPEMRREPYTRHPRPILWLVPEGALTVGGDEGDATPSFTAEVESFYISKFPVTNEQFEAFDPGYLRSPVCSGDRDPATEVSWEDAVAYCEWYAEVSGKEIRLPTEIEWEHACRGGVEGRFFFGDPEEADEYLWDADNSDGQMRRLDDKKANEHGLFGMLGGVWEWTGSLFAPYPLDPETGESLAQDAGDDTGGDDTSGNETEAEAGRLRVARGGSFRTPRDRISCSHRRPLAPDTRLDDLGFRIVKSLK
jgi:formylglycine-generating enzyme required for sulfatase activity